MRNLVTLSLTVLMLTLVASCNKDDGNAPHQEEEINFFLRVTRPESKAVADPIPDDHPVDFVNGGIFFADGSGNIVRYVRITTAFATGTVSPTELEAGHLFAGVSNKAETVHIVGNFDFETEPLPATLASLRAYTQDLPSQSDPTTFGVENASLYGSNQLVPATSAAALAANATRQADIKLKPIIGRLEIFKISADPALVGTFTVQGIYIDNFYFSFNIIGEPIDNDYHEIPYSPAPSNHGLYSRTTGYSTADWYPYVYDDGGATSPGLGTPTATGELEPETGKAWAYNVYPDDTHQPHIIIHLTNVTIDDGSGTMIPYPNTTVADGTAYLTVTGYRDTGGNRTLEGGQIFKIQDLAFTPTDLRIVPKGPDPEDPEPPFDVWVDVEVVNWKAFNVDVNFN